MMEVMNSNVVKAILKPRRTALLCATDSNHRDAELVLRELMGLELPLCCNLLQSEALVKFTHTVLKTVEGLPYDAVRKCGLDIVECVFVLMFCQFVV